jgi:hypothetical protein
MPEVNYTGTEPAVSLGSTTGVDSDEVFELRPPRVPAKAVPIFDQGLGAVVGYRDEATTGVYRIYDLEGNVVAMEEKGLDSPDIDPIDLIFFFSGIARTLGKGVLTGLVRQAPKVAALTGARLSAGLLVATIVGALRTVFKGLAVRELKFTATTAARMMSAGRHVPVHILHLAIKYGKRVPDPQGAKGAFLFATKMLKNGKEYLLEVVVREADWTILHFLYK